MTVKSDIEIAQSVNMRPVKEIAETLGLREDDLEFYGKYKAKIDYNSVGSKEGKEGKLVLVTAINPTPAGEGKTTTTVGLGDALKRIGKKAVIALREPSLGPVFGIKGGAAGGGYAQVVPMEDINLHFTGDMHAIGAANNLLAALILHTSNNIVANLFLPGNYYMMWVVMIAFTVIAVVATKSWRKTDRLPGIPPRQQNNS